MCLCGECMAAVCGVRRRCVIWLGHRDRRSWLRLSTPSAAHGSYGGLGLPLVPTPFAHGSYGGLGLR